jgi:phage gpG-like protein
MAGFSFDFSAMNKFARDLGKIVADIQKNERTAVKLAGNEYKSDVQKIIQYKTGTLRRSVHVELTTEGLRQVALVGTDVPYARRLELGFMDKDSRGRVYHQAPAPRWRPAFDNNLPKYRAMMIAALAGKPYAEGI